MINPKSVGKSDECIETEEGCLSIPEFHGKTKRYKQVTVEYSDGDFQKHKIEKVDGHLAICSQHEKTSLMGYFRAVQNERRM